MRVSFDFDSTLNIDRLESLFDRFSWANEMYIITTRVGHKIDVFKNQDLFQIAKKYEISTDNIVFTNGEDKWPVIKDLGIHLHFDDDEIECQMINENTDCVAIHHQFRHKKKK